MGMAAGVHLFFVFCFFMDSEGHWEGRCSCSEGCFYWMNPIISSEPRTALVRLSPDAADLRATEQNSWRLCFSAGRVKTNSSLINREAGNYFPWDERICRLDLCPVGSNRPQDPHCCIQAGEDLPLSGLIFCPTNISIPLWTKDDFLKKQKNTWNLFRFRQEW